MDKIYARFSYHREKIIRMESLYNKPANNFALISICIELKMKVV